MSCAMQQRFFGVQSKSKVTIIRPMIQGRPRCPDQIGSKKSVRAVTATVWLRAGLPCLRVCIDRLLCRVVGRGSGCF